MNKYWVSWYHYSDMGDFTFVDENPCWESGYLHAKDVREDSGRNIDSAYIYVAALKSISCKMVKPEVFFAYEQKVEEIDFRFIIKKPAKWSPFCERFPRADWMVWD